LGYPPTIEEYADWWGTSRSTAFREQARFRDAFPDETTPERVVQLLFAQDEKWYRSGVTRAARFAVKSEEFRSRMSGGGAAGDVEAEPAL
jgi:hypothetical protein